MKNNTTLKIAKSKIVLTCSGLSAVLGFTGALGWVSGWRVLDAISSRYTPMKPDTALALIVMGCAMYAYAARPRSRAARGGLVVAAALGLVFGCATLFNFVTRGGTDLNDVFLNRTGMLGVSRIGPMSPLTACCFILSAAAVFLTAVKTRIPSSYPGVAIMAVSAAHIIGYWFGTPLLYGGTAVPMALTTGIAFFLLGAGFTAAAGGGAWPLSALSGQSTRARLLRALLPAIFALMLVENWLNVILAGKKSADIVLVFSLTALLMLLIAYVVVSQVSKAVGGAIDRAEAQLARISRAQQTVDMCNKVLAHAVDETALLRAICAVVVEKGGYRMAWVGYAQNDAGQSVKPVMQMGDEMGYLDKIRISWGDNDLGRGPTGAAIREGRPVAAQILATAKNVEPWRKLMNEHGFAASIALPLNVEGATLGALTIYSGLESVFDDEEIRLLAVLAEDIAYGIRVLRAESALRESEDKFRRIVTHSPDIIFKWDVGKGLEYVSPSAFDITGFTPQELCAKPFLIVDRFLSVVNDGDEADKRRNFISKILEKQFREACFVHKNGHEICLELRFNPIEDENGNVVAFDGAFRDVTAQRKSEEENRILREQLHQSQKMESVGQLAGGVAHDFNNLLTPIIGYSQIAMMKLNKNEPLYGQMKQILDAGTRARDLTKSLLAFGRKQTLVMKTLDLGKIISDMDKILRRLVMESIDIEYFVDKALGGVMADPSQMQQILINLVVNANDAMPDGGKLVIETANTELSADYCKSHEEVEPGRYVMLAVSDSGHGMTEDIRRRIFEPFFTTKEVGKGTGLGLATVYGIVKQHGGSIFVYSEPGHGSTFKVYLPRVDSKADGAVFEEGELGFPGSETVLVVEDEEVVRNLAKAILDTHGYRVITVASPADALQYIETCDKPIHLLLTDVIMPGMNGRELYKKAAVIQPGIRVLFMSGYTRNIIAHHGVLDEGIHYLQKPFTMQSLTKKVREALEG